ncbi:ATP-dependent DNA helicase Q1 [Mycena venus]|uniref:ATP-dependent DNA helicase Q1 n=1 Tax=Mycena venus TaxID=2733690 RepID=A0A8H6XV40_9AGAR|nr:ATP-dependent DNA helicase Q1 [Mycena venus]
MSETFVWSSPEGFALARRIVKLTPVPYAPHDHQLEGVCKSLDAVSLFAITPTGSGKTSYYILYILIILEVLKDPDLCPSANFPKNPVLLVICPTIPLQIEMASNMTKLGLKAIAINSETKTFAHHEDKDLWRLARTEPNVVLTGPEQLKTADFEKAIRDTTFYERICALFAKNSSRWAFLRARLTDHHNPWILTSATVRDGAPFDSICRLLGLRPDNFHLIRRSCARPDVQILFRDLTSPINGESFPELDWILNDNRPTVVYPKTYSLGSRLYTYFLRKLNLDNTTTRIRLYNSLNFDSHNAETRIMLEAAPGDPDYCQVIIGTDSLSVGVGMPARLDAVIVGDIDDTDEVIQKLGRVGRTPGHSHGARGIVYVSAAQQKAAEKALGDEASVALKPGQKPIDLSFPRMVVAPCKVKCIDELYNNPAVDLSCSCTTCSQTPPRARPSFCNCSGCLSEQLPSLDKTPRVSRMNPDIPKPKRLTKLQREHGQKRLVDLRLEIWKTCDRSTQWMLPPLVFLLDSLITAILDNFALLNNFETVSGFLAAHTRLKNHSRRVLEALKELQPEFVTIAAARKAENAENRKAKRAAEAKDTGDSNDEGEDVEMEDVEGLRDVTDTVVNKPAPTKKKTAPQDKNTPPK